MTQPIRIHPQNSKIFEFRGKPLVLVTATEHYGAVMNRPFRFERYLEDAAEKGITLTRLFVLFRELQVPMNPYSTCKPESPEYIAPFERTGPGHALDGEPKFDLDRPNEEFYERLHRFLSLASDYGIIVEVVLLSNTYNDKVWSLNPLNAANNVNSLPEIHWQEYVTMRHEAMFERQAAHVRKIVTETNRYDNIIYEICNEPGVLSAGKQGDPSPDDVNAWLSALIKEVRETEAGRLNQHLIVGQESYTAYDEPPPLQQPSDLSFHELDYDVVNMHPLPNTMYGGQNYHMGDFMSKQLRLRALRDYCLATYDEPKPLNQDEDNIASQYRDPDGWTIHRKRAWVTLLSGAHYDYIDFSILPWLETGTPESQRHIRTWMGYLSAFIHSLDLVRARPLSGFLTSQPENTLEAVFCVEGEDICIYLADERELPAARGLTDVTPGAGRPISGEIAFDLPEGSYEVASYDPKTGQYSQGMNIAGGEGTHLSVASFVHDTVIRVQR